MLDLYYQRQHLIQTVTKPINNVNSLPINPINEYKQPADQANTSKLPINQQKDKAEVVLHEGILSMAQLSNQQVKMEKIVIPPKKQRSSKLHKAPNSFSVLDNVTKQVTRLTIQKYYQPQFVGYYCFKSVCTWMRIIFPVLASLFDGISDVLYMIYEWDNIATPELKSLIIFFTFDYIIVMSLVLLYLDLYSQPTKCQYILLFLPIYPIFVALRIYQIVRASNKKLRETNMERIKQELQRLQQQEERSSLAEAECGNFNFDGDKQMLVNKTWQVLYFTTLFSLLQAIPQIIVQSINNNMNSQWNSVSLMSFVCSLMAIVFSFIQISGQVIDVTQQYGQDHYNICYRMTWTGSQVRIYAFCLIGTIVGALVSGLTASQIGQSSAVFGFIAGISTIVFLVIANLCGECCCYSCCAKLCCCCCE